MTKKTNDMNVMESSGNVFTDLGFPNADRGQLKASLGCRSTGPSRTAASHKPTPERF